ncbi:MAG TPA: orotidine-5'-phosphate decarboxylase, partial [Lentisphaeria bacterium]|nr:orotidine-5'-phosphate decarboxylase [Lentisphaeria bacterium]
MGTTLITALDVDTQEAALAIADRIGAAAEWFKVGKQLFTRCGAEVVRGLKARGKKVFLDLKYHDIPNTVEQAVRAAAAIGADLCNVHASGGPAMLRAAAKAGVDTGMPVIAVTVLTSMDQAELNAIGITETPAEAVLRLARLTKDCGLPGVVCSAHEIAPLREAFGPDFLLVVPGIRPAGTSLGDQKRVMTPA